jgi:dissimilatory sulfite reductase (desulfoviridin) alpha/beta subunit
MSCRFADNWGIGQLTGVEVDEQIVMSPETQTVKQIRKEENEEVKRIRIDRYGWNKYFEEINAKTIDERDNDIEGTKEFLLRSDEDDMTALLCV